MSDLKTKRWFQSAVVALLMLGTGQLGHLLAIPPGLATPVWLPSGITVAAVIVLGPKIWPGIFLGSFLVGLLPLLNANLPASNPLLALVSILIAAGVTAEPLLATRLYDRFRYEAPFVSRARNVAVLMLLAAPVGCVVSATVGSTAIAASGLIPWARFGETWTTWMIGDMVGIYSLTPALLVWTQSGRAVRMTGRDSRIAAASVVALGVVCAMTFLDVVPDPTAVRTLAFLPIPLMVFLAYRFNDQLASLVGPGVSAVAVLAAFRGSGPFGNDPGHPALIALQLFVLVGILTALFTRAVANERNAAENETQLLASQLAHVSRVTMMGEIAAGMAHEYHQPLAAISNYASASLIKLRRFESALAEVHEPLERIVDEAMRAAEIVDRMKNFLQKREPARTKCDINELVADAVMLTRTAHSFPHISLRHEPTAGLPLASIDEVQITQILVNLLVNSCEAIEQSETREGEVCVRVRMENADRIHVCVEDNGPGMDEATAAACFDQFYSTKEHGLGIGLGISRTLAQAHGGRLSHESKPGKGTKFCLDLPVHQPSSPARNPVNGSRANVSRA